MFCECFLVSTSLQIRDIFQQWLELKKSNAVNVFHPIEQFVENRIRRILTNTEKEKLKFTLFKISSNWVKYRRGKSRFETALSNWLDTEIFNEDICVVSILMILDFF